MYVHLGRLIGQALPKQIMMAMAVEIQTKISMMTMIPFMITSISVLKALLSGFLRQKMMLKVMDAPISIQTRMAMLISKTIVQT